MKKIVALSLVILLAGCAAGISDIDVSKKEPVCVRQCAANYSACVSGGNQVGFKTETLNACKEAYSVCANTCL